MDRPKLWQDWNARVIYVKSLLDWHGFIVVEWQRNSVIQIWIRTRANSVLEFHVQFDLVKIIITATSKIKKNQELKRKENTINHNIMNKI